MTDLNENAVNAIAELARNGVKPISIEAAPGFLFAYREGQGVAPIDIRKYAHLPASYAGTTCVFTVNDFMAAMLANGAHPVASAVFVDDNPSSPAIVGIVDYGTQDNAMWRKDRVMIEFRHTPEWVRFVQRSGHMTDAVDFANFIEDNLSSFETPSAAQLMEVVQNFEVRSDVICKQAVRIDNGGVELSFSDSPSASVKGNKVTVPSEFSLTLTPFQGSATYRVKAVFRWEHRNGTLKFGYKILDLEKYVRDAVADFKAAILEFPVNVRVAPEKEGDAETISQMKMRVFSGVAPAETRI